jgi:hemerythrin-like domain-containing protein
MSGHGGAIEAIPSDLVADPLNFFFAEHYRHRQLCNAIEDLAASSFFDAERITEIIDFLRFEAPVHIIDEEEDLFPLLRRRCLPEDDVEGVLGVLSSEHKADGVLGRRVRDHLETCLTAHVAPGADMARRTDLKAFASQERSHLALENAVVLPIARLRLTDEDLRGLSRRLAARRGLVLDAPQ